MRRYNNYLMDLMKNLCFFLVRACVLGWGWIIFLTNGSHVLQETIVIFTVLLLSRSLLTPVIVSL